MNYLRAKKLLFILFFVHGAQLYCVDESRSATVLRFLYQNAAGRVVRSFITRSGYFSAFTGWLANRSASKYIIPTFIKQYRDQINMNEALKPDIKSYKTFNKFFKRKLKPDCRPIDSAIDSVTSPADGTIYAIEQLNEKTEFLVKGKKFDVARLLGKNSHLSADIYKNGTMIIIYLGPWNYHRFHFPVDCSAQKAQIISGAYESVNSVAYQFGIQPLTENERHLIEIDHPDTGKIAFIPVGALCVGKIKEKYDPEKELHKKGDQVGYFEFGGSTIVMLFPENTITLDERFKNTATQPLEIKVGERIATIIKKNERP
ncbi:MAG TPA: archaetidylserine decarboxylase [Candidatus Babeliales bacterium]|nr:archaetidylserine decarboxylase [Candidatus Babeliales bacterium]